MTFHVTTPKPPSDRWPVLIDFSDRLNLDGGEGITAASIHSYRLWGYDSTIDELDLTDAVKFSAIVERADRTTKVISYLLSGQDSAQVRIPKDYNATLDQTVVDIGSMEIGPAYEDSKVSFVLQSGKDTNRYSVRVKVITSHGNEHSCVLRFTVGEIPL